MEPEGVVDPGDLAGALEESGALKRGHFKLSSGRHSDTYVQCALLLRSPREAVAAGRALAGKVTEGVASGGKATAGVPPETAAVGPAGGIDLVLSPAVGALLVGFTTALALGCDMVFAERVEGRMTLRRGFEIPPGASVLIVEDVITTGGSAMELAAMVEGAGASVSGIACIIERGRIEGCIHPVYPLLSLDVASYAPEECPLCREGRPIDSPGSRYLA